ncbi:hypothetical protein LWI29_012236 [Acer saccharum]|uniref:Uncharacterized protein n=1 Tax=Acer saccharum TaxID=4024 RepID=A0AA39SAT1_ACESA|nr:hypothetical protein LWI29_012236 [Acer saccharum]
MSEKEEREENGFDLWWFDSTGVWCWFDSAATGGLYGFDSDGGFVVIFFVNSKPPSNKRSRSSKSGAATPSRHAKASDSFGNPVAPEQDERKKKRKRSSSACLASLDHEGFVAFIVDSLRSEEKDKGCNLVSLALAGQQATKGNRVGGFSACLAPLVPLQISRTTRPPSPTEKIGDEIGLGEGNVPIEGNFSSTNPLMTPVEVSPRELAGTVGHPASSENLLRQQVGAKLSERDIPLFW